MGTEVTRRVVIRPEHREPDLVQVADFVAAPAHAEAFHVDAALPRSWALVCERPAVDVSWTGAVSLVCEGAEPVVMLDVDIEEFRDYDRRGTLPYGIGWPVLYTSFDLDHVVSLSEVRRRVHVCDLPVGGLDGRVTAERRDGAVMVGGRPITWVAVPVGRFDLAWSRAMLG